MNRLPWQQPIQAKHLERYVYNEAQLRDALARLPENGNCNSKCIVIAQSIVVKKKLSLSAVHSGLTIKGSGNALIYCDDTVLFETTDIIDNLSIKDLTVTPSTGSPLTYLLQHTSVNPLSFLTIENVVASGIHIDFSTGGVDYGYLFRVKLGAGNLLGAMDTSSVLACTFQNLTSAALIATCVSSCPAIVGAVTLTGTSTTCAFSGNIFIGGSIDTSASGGVNTIFGNANLGASITSHATDAVGLNT